MASGLRDWKIQRLTAVFLAFYVGYFVYSLWMQPLNNRVAWQHFMHQPWMQIATILALVSLLWHAWIGLWTVATDYIKSSAVRCVFLSLVLLTLCAEGLWGLYLVLGGAL